VEQHALWDALQRALIALFQQFRFVNYCSSVLKSGEYSNQRNTTISKQYSQHHLDMAEPDASPAKDLRLGFVDMLQRLENLMRAKGEIFRAQAYKKAQDELLGSNTPITSAKQLERLPGIGATMLKKFDEYSKTGQLKALMKPEDQAWITLTGVHGIGPKKAKELISEGITTIEGLRKASTENAKLLNAKQRMGLAHYEELQERIPREEIQRFEARLTEVWQSVVPKNDPKAEMMIVGSYRRGAASSGDIDVIITSGNDNMDIHKNFVKALQNSGVLTDLLSTGKTKTLAIGKLPDSNKHRRIDIMYSPPDEYPFAVLYFTGSRSFNIAMRNRALGMGYSLSEHGFIDTATKGKVEVPMKTEEDIFKFLGMKFKQPVERTGVLAVQAAEGAKPVARETVKAKKAATKTASTKTVKKRTVKDVRTPKPIVPKTPKTVVKTPKTVTKEEKKEEVPAEQAPAENEVKKSPPMMISVSPDLPPLPLLLESPSPKASTPEEKKEEPEVEIPQFVKNETNDGLKMRFKHLGLDTPEITDENRKAREVEYTLALRKRYFDDLKKADEELKPELTVGQAVQIVSEEMEDEEESSSDEDEEEEGEEEEGGEEPEVEIPQFVKNETNDGLKMRFKHLGMDTPEITDENRKAREVEYTLALRKRYFDDLKEKDEEESSSDEEKAAEEAAAEEAAAEEAAPAPSDPLTMLPPSPIPLASPSPKKEPTPKVVKKVTFQTPKPTPRVSVQVAKKPTMKQNLAKFTAEGAKALEALDQRALEMMHRKANKAYREGDPIMTDTAFDVLDEYLKEKFPQSKVHQTVGAKTKRVEVDLPYTLFSMNKVKPGQGKLEAWKKKYSGPYVVSAKLDGASALYIVGPDGAQLLTHGEVKKGDTSQKGGDVSHLIPKMGLAPSTLFLPPEVRQAGLGPNERMMIRGEIVLDRKAFEEKYSDTYANPRNMVAGLINALDEGKHGERQKDLEFVAFEVIEPIGLKPSLQLSMLEPFKKQLGISVVKHDTIEKPEQLTEEYLSKEFVDLRENHPYECDGVIVVDDKVYARKNQNPDHALAFKMIVEDQMAEATIRDISWRVSKDGYIKPTVHVNPVKVPGATIRKITGHDAKTIQSKRLGPGATVVILRRGDVIPHVEKVKTPASEEAMKEAWWKGPYEWSESGVDIRLPAEAMLDEEWNTEMRFANVKRFFDTIKAKGLGEKAVRKLFDEGYDTVAKIATATPQELTRIEGFQATSARNIVEGVQKAIADASAQKLMVGSNLFGRGTGRDITANILKKFPNVLHFQTEDPVIAKRLENGISAIKGISQQRALQFVAALPKFREFLKPLRPDLVEAWEPAKALATATPGTSPAKSSGAAAPKPTQPNHPLAGKEVVTTGIKVDQVEPLLETVGATIGNGVKAETAVVVVRDDPTYSSGKTKKAEKLNIPMMTIDEFTSKYFPA
jgi:DNA ligase (NAD+)